MPKIFPGKKEEPYVPAEEKPALKETPKEVPAEGRCKTPGCHEPLAPDQPNVCVLHTRRN